LFSLLFVCISAQNAGPFEVTADTLPSYVGPNPLPFKSYTGYVEVNSTLQRNNFYWLVESQSATPEQDPLLFWYQGGPGCSGLGGMFTEHGPFRATADQTLVLADFSWNEFANVVYLEQPTGVGFSYSGKDEPGYTYTCNDEQAAEENFNFIEGFLDANPKYVGRPTWIAGESYGGVYVPTLGALISSRPSSRIYKQFTGQMTGNPVFSCDSLDTFDAQMRIFYQHQLISYITYSQWINHDCPKHSKSIQCLNIFQTAYRSVGQIYQELGVFTFNGTQPSLDPDNLWQDFITGNTTLEWQLTLLEDAEPGVIDVAADYLNRQDVQSAIHAHSPPAGEWSFCNFASNWKYTTSGKSMIPYYQYTIKNRPDVHILVYSGDVDIATCPPAETQICLAEIMGTPVNDRSWQPWFANGATAGYVEVFDQYTYVTIKGSGHEAPTFQPFTSFAMYQRFLQNQNLDGGEVYFPPSAPPRKRLRRQGDVLREFGITGLPN
jgi:serine carboxypeptidase-like clade 2